MRIMFAALLPFALSFGLAIYVAAEMVIGTSSAGTAAAVTTLLALFFWYGMGQIIPKLNS